MANPIQIKGSSTLSTPTGLLPRELCYCEPNKKLYISKINGVLEVIGGAGEFAKIASPALTGTPTSTTPSGSDNSTRIATTAFVKALNYLTGNQTITLSGDVTGSGTTSITATLANSGITPGAYTKPTFNAKGIATSGSNLTETDIPDLTSSKITDFTTAVRTNRLDQMANPTASVSMNNQALTNLPTPINSGDAVNKQYADAMKENRDTKDSVKVATTENITLSGIQTIDTISGSADMRVLVKNQTTASENGIYDMKSGSWVRSSDADTSTKVTTGMYCFVEQGSANGGNGFSLITTGTIDLGVTNLVFTVTSGAGQIDAGAGLSKTGNQLNVNVGQGIEIISDNLEVKLDSNTLSKGVDGVKVTDDTFTPYSHSTSSGDVHSQYVNKTTGGIITAQHSFSPPSSASPFLVGANAVNQLVTGLNSEFLGGQNSAYYRNLTNMNAGILPVPRGGSGVATITGIIKGNGASAFSAATPHTDYLNPSSNLDYNKLINLPEYWAHNTTHFPEGVDPLSFYIDSQEFLTSGNFYVPLGIYLCYVTLLGGGGGGARAGGGGGGGFYIIRFPIAVTPEEEILVIVGSGGTGGISVSVNGGNGGSTSFGALTVAGGLGGRQSSPRWGMGSHNGGNIGFPGDSSPFYSGGTIGNSSNCGGGGGAGFNGSGGNGGNSTGAAGGNAANNSGAGGGGGYGASFNGNGGTGGTGYGLVEWIYLG